MKLAKKCLNVHDHVECDDHDEHTDRIDRLTRGTCSPRSPMDSHLKETIKNRFNLGALVKHNSTNNFDKAFKARNNLSDIKESRKLKN